MYRAGWVDLSWSEFAFQSRTHTHTHKLQVSCSQKNLNWKIFFVVVPHAPIYHILLGWNNIFNSYWQYNEKPIDWIWLGWTGQYLACEPTIFPVQCDQTQSINTLYIGYNSQGTRSDIFHFTCNYRCILQRLYWCCTVAEGSDHVLIQIICFWELPPFFSSVL